MKMMANLLALAALLSCAMTASAFQGASVAGKEPGSVEGAVVNALTGEPVRRVNLTLSPNSGHKEPLTAQSGDKGQFSFQKVEPGSYRLSGEKAGFLKQNYGARLNPDSGAILVVRSGQAINDLSFRLAPSAVISGRVLDQDGEPMPNLVITALRHEYSRGRRDWMPAGSGSSNDRGEFRIPNLRAGRHIICATDMRMGIGMVGVSGGALPDKPEPSYASTYLGNTSDITRAAPIELRMGEDRRGAEIQMIKTATVRVRGRIAGAPDGKMLLVLLLRRGPASAGGSPAAAGLVQPADNTFELRGILPGSYLMMARSATEVMTALGAPMPLEVGDRHIDGLEYQLAPGGEITGEVTISGATPELRNATVSLSMVDFQMPDPPSGKVENGRFQLRNVGAGKHRARVTGLPENCYVKSVKLNGQDVDSDGFEIGASGGKMEILVSRAGGQLQGKATSADGRPQPSAMVTLIPQSGKESEYRTGLTDHAGAFTLKGIAPGKYKALAWEDIEPGAHLDPEFIKTFESFAQSFTFEENGRLEADLKVIPFEKVTGNR